MSWFRFAGASRKGTSREGFLTRFFSRPTANSRRAGSRGRASQKRNFDLQRGRRLAIDPLESRCLLSVTPSTLSAIVVNQTFGAAQATNTAHSVAVDNSGDFVVTWTRSGTYTGSSGTAFPDTNVFARYYTNAVQQVNLPTSLMTTTGTKQSYFSLKYNDQTITQISISGESQAPAGNTTALFTGTNISGTFVLFFNATGNDAPGQLDPTVNGGTQSNLLTVTYDETALYNAQGVEIAGPAIAAEQIQNWLNAFAPEAASGSFAGSDATHATVNSIDAHTFVVDYGQATEGLDQSSLLQYVGTEASAAIQDMTFTSTAGFTTQYYTGPMGTILPGMPQTTPNIVPPEEIALQVGTVQTAPFLFDMSNPATTALAMQTALQAAGLAGATVTVGFPTAVGVAPLGPVNTVDPFEVTFATDEPPLQYVVPATDFVAPELTFTNTADIGSLTGFLPSVTISTLDKPFAINNIPFSQTNPTLTAEAIVGAFQAQVNAFSTGVAPINFVSLSPQTNFNISGTIPIQNPYDAPIYNNVGASTANSDIPVTGWDPTVTVAPVVQVNSGTSDTSSFTQFTITFTSATGTIVDAPLVVTGFTTANGVVTPGGTTTLDGTVTLPANAAGSTVTVVKQSGNEFQVNPTQPASVYTANQAPLNATQPAVAIDGSGDFVVTWAGDVSQNLAPKDFTDVYARVYAPVGVTPAGTAVPDSVTSDLYQQQVLQFSFPAGSGTPTTGETFELQLGSFTDRSDHVGHEHEHDRIQHPDGAGGQPRIRRRVGGQSELRPVGCLGTIQRQSL